MTTSALDRSIANMDKLLQTDVAVRDVDTLMSMMREKVKTHRIDVVFYFEQFDPLRSGHITTHRFRAGLNTQGLVQLNDAETALFLQRYAHRRDRTQIDYRQFIQHVESTLFPYHADRRLLQPDFDELSLALEREQAEQRQQQQQKSPSSSSLSSAPPTQQTFAELQQQQQQQAEAEAERRAAEERVSAAEAEQQARHQAALNDVLATAARAIRTNRINCDSFFKAHDKMGVGYVTANKFSSCMSQCGLMRWLSPRDIAFLVAHYAATETHMSYRQFFQDLENLDNK